MNANTLQIPKSREDLNAALVRNRRESMKASERRDFRAIARLTLEAARLNRALSDTLTNEEMAR